MNIPPKYEDLVFQLNELNKREAALQEEIEMAKQVQETTDAIVAMVDGQRDRWIDKCGLLKQRLTVAEQRAGELTESLQLATRLLNASKANLKPTGKLGKAIRDFLNSRYKEDVAKLRDFFSTKSTDNSEDEQDQRVGFVRMNTKTDQPRISMADMNARYKRKPCQEPQAHPTR